MTVGIDGAHQYFGRGLAEMEARVGAGRIEAFLSGRLEQVPDVRVLELGSGEGHALLELARRFPRVELHGVNRSPSTQMRGVSSLWDTALRYRIFEPWELPWVRAPILHFCDAAVLPLESDSVDLVLSQATFHFVRRKDRALEEIIRVLRPGGEAHIHLDSTPPPAAGFYEGPTPRFVVREGDDTCPLTTVLTDVASVAHAALEVAYGPGGGSRAILHVRKLRPGGARLALTLDRASHSLSAMSSTGGTDGWYGYRSVFRRAHPRRREATSAERVATSHRLAPAMVEDTVGGASGRTGDPESIA